MSTGPPTKRLSFQSREEGPTPSVIHGTQGVDWVPLEDVAPVMTPQSEANGTERAMMALLCERQSFVALRERTMLEKERLIRNIDGEFLCVWIIDSMIYAFDSFLNFIFGAFCPIEHIGQIDGESIYCIS